MITITQKIHFTRVAAGRRRIVTDPPPPDIPIGRTPRISKLMALAIKFEGLLRSGAVKDQSELARVANVTQPRMTQIMNLLHLAATIQEELLFLLPVTAGRDPIHEKLLRPVAAEICWARQQEMWRALKEKVTAGLESEREGMARDG
jgi:hypothetical protein